MNLGTIGYENGSYTDSGLLNHFKLLLSYANVYKSHSILLAAKKHFMKVPL